MPNNAITDSTIMPYAMLRSPCRGPRIEQVATITEGSHLRGIFLDRDGVINHDSKDYIRTFEQFRYIEGTEEAFRTLATTRLPIVVVTNQSGLARGYTTIETVSAIHDKLSNDVLSWGAKLASIEHCPHHPDESCRCRKPEPGMFERGAERAAVTLAGSYLVGDAPTDIEAGRRLGMVTIRVLTGRGSEPGPASSHEVANLRAASELIARLESGEAC